MSIEKHRAELIEVIARKLRVVVTEFGESVLEGSSIVSSHAELGGTVCGFHHYYCPTIGDARLMIRIMPELNNNLSYKAARLFVDTP